MDGAYILFIDLPRQTTIDIGGLGNVRFSPGLYAYVGSARRGLKARVSRHLSPTKRARWHIDYLTPYAVDSWYTLIPATEPPECFIARQLLKMEKKVVKGFGASDCSCPSHLVYLGESSIRRTRSADT